MSDRTTTGSRSLGGRRRAPLGWVPWLALALLALLGLIAFLVIRNVANAGDKGGVDATNDRAGGATESGGSSSGGGGTLTAGGRPLLPLSAAGSLASLSGQTVTGKGVMVESVVADEGFWVGPSPTDRIFVSLLPQARGSAGESAFQVRKGQRVDVAGTLRPVPSNLAALGVDEAEGAAQLRSQGQYIEATTVRLS